MVPSFKKERDMHNEIHELNLDDLNGVSGGKGKPTEFSFSIGGLIKVDYVGDGTCYAVGVTIGGTTTVSGGCTKPA
jgi:hypothetical protein